MVEFKFSRSESLVVFNVPPPTAVATAEEVVIPVGVVPP